MGDGELNDLQDLVSQYNWDLIKRHVDVYQCCNKMRLFFDQACPIKDIEVKRLDLPSHT